MIPPDMILLEWRRRAVVCGVATGVDGAPWVQGHRLSLHAAEPEGPPGRGRTRFACRMRDGGHFYFLDVPPGRYELRRTGDAGAPLQTDDIVVDAYGPEDKVPILRLNYRIRPDALREAPSPPHPSSPVRSLRMRTPLQGQ